MAAGMIDRFDADRISGDAEIAFDNIQAIMRECAVHEEPYSGYILEKAEQVLRCAEFIAACARAYKD